MKIRRILTRQPEVALGVAVFAGLAIGAGWISLPSFGSLGSLLPGLPASSSPSTTAPAPAASATATPAAPSPSMWD